MSTPTTRLRASSLIVALLVPSIATAAGHPKGAAHANHSAGAGAQRHTMHQQQAVMRQHQAIMKQQQAAIRQQQAAAKHKQAARNTNQGNVNASTNSTTNTTNPATGPNLVASNTARTRVAGTRVHHNGYGARRYVGGRRMYANNNQNVGPLVSALQGVVSRLNQADHDYNGHRVQAIHHVQQAIRTLQNRSDTYGLGSANSARPAANVNAARGKMLQAQSDAHLNAARQSLMGIQSQMSSGMITTTSRHQQAYGHVQRAIQELGTALAIR